MVKNCLLHKEVPFIFLLQAIESEQVSAPNKPGQEVQWGGDCLPLNSPDMEGDKIRKTKQIRITMWWMTRKVTKEAHCQENS